MAYKLMTRLIENYEAGKTTYTKERLAEMTDVYFACGRLSSEQYSEIIEKLNAIEE